MNKNILVTYASKYGATKEIAEKIGEMLRQNGEQVDVLPVGWRQVCDSYQAVILGSALYVGKWPKEAVRFCKANEKSLADRPFWLFSSGPTGEGDPLKLVDGKSVPADMQSTIERIHPRDVTVFHGNINLEKISGIEKWAIKSVVKKPFGDFRDWEMINAWTNKMVDAMNVSS